MNTLTHNEVEILNKIKLTAYKEMIHLDYSLCQEWKFALTIENLLL